MIKITKLIKLYIKKIGIPIARPRIIGRFKVDSVDTPFDTILTDDRERLPICAVLLKPVLRELKAAATDAASGLVGVVEPLITTEPNLIVAKVTRSTLSSKVLLTVTNWITFKTIASTNARTSATDPPVRVKENTTLRSLLHFQLFWVYPVMHEV